MIARHCLDGVRSLRQIEDICCEVYKVYGLKSVGNDGFWAYFM
jgi:hypothetical protein